MLVHAKLFEPYSKILTRSPIRPKLLHFSIQQMSDAYFSISPFFTQWQTNSLFFHSPNPSGQEGYDNSETIYQFLRDFRGFSKRDWVSGHFFVYFFLFIELSFFCYQKFLSFYFHSKNFNSARNFSERIVENKKKDATTFPSIFFPYFRFSSNFAYLSFRTKK